MEMGPGTLVRSKAGRDRGALYAVIRSDEKYVYVADGERFPLCRMKKKNRKHLQPIFKVRLEAAPDDKALRDAIRKYKEAM